MGYTHYFRVTGTEPTDTQWEDIVREVKELLESEAYAGDVCRDYDREDEPPQIDEEYIIFNGKGDDGHETFIVQRSMTGFQFCKTARKDYDDAVVECLKIVRKHAPDWLSLGSDGGDEVFGLPE